MATAQEKARTMGHIKQTLKYITVFTQTIQRKKINSQAKEIGRSLHNISPRVLTLFLFRFRFRVFFCARIVISTSIKKERNGPGASEWTHSQQTPPLPP